MIGPRMGPRFGLYLSASIVVAFLMLPSFAVIPASFSESRFIRLPPHALSLRWYREFFADPAWQAALIESMKIALVVTSIAVPLGVAAALALRGLSERGRQLILLLFLMPLALPAVVTALAMYRIALDLQLNSTFSGIVLSHTILALPFVIINVDVSLRALNDDWLKAAFGLGAGAFTAFRTVTLPTIVPGILGGVIFSFVTSFDEFTVALFMTGPLTKTLPIMIWEFIRFEFTPVVAVAATCLIATALALFTVSAALSSLFVRRHR
jgi:putative spermidine/putrescine transport system permease protein